MKHSLGWLGFWIFLTFSVACITYYKIKIPVNPLKYTQEERFIKSVRDPLTSRLYVLNKILPLIKNTNSSSAQLESRKEIVRTVISQWDKEISLLKEKAYRETWDISELPLNNDQMQEIEKLSNRFDIDVMGGN